MVISKIVKFPINIKEQVDLSQLVPFQPLQMTFSLVILIKYLLLQTANDILYDAKFVCYYSFDTIPYLDSGPWNISWLNIGLSSTVSIGYVNNAVSFTSANTYFLFSGLSLLGITGQSYSIALWIKPTSVNDGSIVYCRHRIFRSKTHF